MEVGEAAQGPSQRGASLRIFTLLSAMSGRVSIDPEINGGKPTVTGTRVSVQTVLGHLSAGDSVEDVLDAYPRLTREDVLACLEYAARLAGHSVTFEKIA